MSFLSRRKIETVQLNAFDEEFTIVLPTAFELNEFLNSLKEVEEDSEEVTKRTTEFYINLIVKEEGDPDYFTYEELQKTFSLKELSIILNAIQEALTDIDDAVKK